MASPFERNQQYVRKGDHEYNTQLSRADEKRFLEWAQKNDVQFDPKERTPDYDMRGYWQAFTDPKHPDHDKARPPQQNPNDNKPHFTDYWKTPYHKSFSRDSQWATKDAPRWKNDYQLVDKSGKVLVDERKQSRPIEGTDMARRSSRPQEKTGIDRAVGNFLRFGNDQIPGAKPQRNVVEELLGNLGRGRAGLRGDLVPPSTRFQDEPRQRGATLREGMEGKQVKALQDDLVRAGLLKPGSYDAGKFAGATAAAVRQLEQMHGLNRDAGVAGRQVLGQLRGNAMPPPVPQSRPSTTAPPRSTEPVPKRSPPPVTQQNLPPPVAANPTPNPTPNPTLIPQPSPSPTPPITPPAQAATPPPAPAQQGQPSPSLWSTALGMPYDPRGPDLSQRQALEDIAAVNGMGQGRPVQSTGTLPFDQAGSLAQPVPDLGFMMGRGGQAAPATANAPPLGAQPAAPAPAPDAALLDRQAAAQAGQFPAPTLPLNFSSPQNVIPGSFDQKNPNAANAVLAAENAQRALSLWSPPAPQPQPLAAQPATPPMPPAPAQQMTAPPAGRVPFVDQSVLAANYNAPPLGGKEQGRLGTALDRPSGFNFTKELPPGYVPPLPPRADIAFNAPSLSPAAPKGGPGAVMSPAALASLPGSGLLGSQEARPSLRQAGAMPVPTVQPPSPPPAPTTQREVPPEQRQAELQAALMNRIDDMKAGLAGPFSNPPLPSAGADMSPQATAPPPGGASGYGRDLAAVRDAIQVPSFGTQQDTPQFPANGWGGIPTVQAPPIESIVQPQIDQGGQGLLGGTGLGDQTQNVGPTGGQSDNGVLDAVSAIADSIGGNQQDQQPGGDQGATASAASGDNPFTAAQTAEQQGILAMLEEMFGSGSTR